LQLHVLNLIIFIFIAGAIIYIKEVLYAIRCQINPLPTKIPLQILPVQSKAAAQVIAIIIATITMLMVIPLIMSEL
jgi:hypothetical protein